MSMKAGDERALHVHPSLCNYVPLTEFSHTELYRPAVPSASLPIFQSSFHFPTLKGDT